MGASNAMAAFRMYSGLVPPLSLNLLIYMALVSKDSDEEPWFSQGYEGLARFALGRGRHAALDESDLRAVERGMKPLRDIGAVSTDRHAAARRDGARTARYRLHLDLDAPRKTGGVKVRPRPTKNVGRPAAGTSVSGVDDPRNPVETTHEKWRDDPRNVVPTTHEIRGAEETGGTKRSDNYKEEEKDLRADVAVSRVRGIHEDTISLPTVSPDASPRAGRCEHNVDRRYCHMCRRAARGAA